MVNAEADFHIKTSLHWLHTWNKLQSSFLCFKEYNSTLLLHCRIPLTFKESIRYKNMFQQTYNQEPFLWKMRYEVIIKKKKHCSFVLLLSQSASSLSIPRSVQILRADPPRLPAFLLQPDDFLSFDKWLLSWKGIKKTKSIRVVYDSDLLLHRLLALLSLIPTRDSLGTMVYFDMWNPSHTHPHGHKCTFLGTGWLLVWHWEREWHHEAGGGKHPWLVDSWDCQESGCQCWWSTVSCYRPAQQGLK